MTICTILAAIRSATNEGELRAMADNAFDTYGFDAVAVADIKEACLQRSYELCHPYAVSTNTVDALTPHELAIDMEAVCTFEPRGEHGLEGYQRGESYRCQYVRQGSNPPYYRLFPSKDLPEYYECAIPRVATRYFRIEEKS